MKFLVDVNLPPRLCTWLESRSHESEHLVDLNLLTATDSQIWDLGRIRGIVVISKDFDFYNRAILLGPPPQVVHVAVGNCSNTKLFEIFYARWLDVETALLAGSKLISISQEKMEIFP